MNESKILFAEITNDTAMDQSDSSLSYPIETLLYNIFIDYFFVVFLSICDDLFEINGNFSIHLLRLTIWREMNYMLLLFTADFY